MRALALGARSCLIGRAYIFGLAAGGEAGVARAIEILRSELDVTMALSGVNSVREIGRQVSRRLDLRRRGRSIAGQQQQEPPRPMSDTRTPTLGEDYADLDPRSRSIWSRPITSSPTTAFSIPSATSAFATRAIPNRYLQMQAIAPRDVTVARLITLRSRQQCDQRARPPGLSRALHPRPDLQDAAGRERGRAQPFADRHPVQRDREAAARDLPQRPFPRPGHAGLGDPRARRRAEQHAGADATSSGSRWPKRSARVRSC